MISVRRAGSDDAAAIGVVHVTAWRSTYPGILPADYLARLSTTRQAAHYQAAMGAGVGVHVALSGDRVVGFTSADRSRRPTLAQGEIETLYVLDDFRDHGAGRALLSASAGFLASLGCRSAFAWVLSDNQARWFYERLGAKRTAEETIRFAGADLLQSAYVWPDLSALIPPS